MNTQQVIDYLKEHPDFLIQQTDLLAHLNLPEPVEQGVLSMKDYQLTKLRQQNTELEQRLDRLLDNASINSHINRSILEWCMQILAQDNVSALPTILLEGLREVFSNLKVQLRLWHLPKLSPEESLLLDDEALVYWANSQTHILLGTEVPETIRHWFDNTIQSFACIALKHPASASMGVLVFGSENAQHFHPDEDVYFLDLIAKLAIAALSRLS